MNFVQLWITAVEFEASKRTSAPSILQNKWKLSSAPLYRQLDPEDCEPGGEFFGDQDCQENDDWNFSWTLDKTKRDFIKA